MAYASASNVAALCQNILGGASNFSASSSPTTTSVCAWLDEGGGVVDLHLAAQGYDTPAPSSATLYPYLTNLNVLYAAAFVELSRINVTLGMGERTRGQVFMQMFWDGLERLSDKQLTGGGATISTDSGTLYAAGISAADKETYEDDTDRVTPRFVRGLFRFPGAGGASKVSDNS